jgi:hypothetical protein
LRIPNTAGFITVAQKSDLTCQVNFLNYTPIGHMRRTREELMKLTVNYLMITLLLVLFSISLSASEEPLCFKKEMSAKFAKFNTYQWLSAQISKIVFWKIEINDFSTDGCSSFPEGSLQQPNLWLHCCVIHDVTYFGGGERERRIKADKELNKCVKEASGRTLVDIINIDKDLSDVDKKSGLNKIENPLGDMMEKGVFVGGSAFLPTSWRWAYGWSAGKNYQTLNKREKKIVKEKLKKYFTHDCPKDKDLLALVNREKTEEKRRRVLTKVCDPSRLDRYLSGVD